jgi:hypothetical protein
MKIHKKIFCVTGIGILLSGATLFAADKTVKEIVNSAYAQIGSMDRYAFTASVLDTEPQEDGTVKHYEHDVFVKVDRPGKVRIDSKGGVVNRSSYINNGLFTMIDHGFGYYGSVKTPKTIDGALDFIFEKYGINPPLASLIYSDMHKRTKFRSSKYFGTMEVAGAECDYVAFKNKTKEVHVWITTGETPLVKTYSVIDTTVEPHSRIDTSVKWDISPSISESDFLFRAPKGVSEIAITNAN